MHSCACREHRRHRRRRTPRPRLRSGDDTTEHSNQDLNEHEESSHDADSNPCFDEMPEDELEMWVDYKMRATHKVDDLSAANGITSWILRQPNLLEAGKDDCQAPRRPLDKSLSPTGTQQYQPSKKNTGNKEDQLRDGKTTSTSTYNQIEPTGREQRPHE